MTNTKTLEDLVFEIRESYPECGNIMEYDEAVSLVRRYIDEATAPYTAKLASAEAMCDRLAEALEFTSGSLYYIGVQAVAGHSGFNMVAKMNANKGRKHAAPVLDAYTAHKEGR